MNYDEAKKSVQGQKTPRENYMILCFSHGCSLVVPYKDGIAVLAALKSAEHFDDGWGATHTVLPLEGDTVQTKILSWQEYERRKTAALLNVTLRELADIEEAQKPKE